MASTTGASSTVWRYRSRPDLSPPRLNITIPADSVRVSPGYIFVTPCPLFDAPAAGSGPEQPGAYILRDDGDLVWSSLGFFGGWTANFKPTWYKGKPVLQAFQGALVHRHAHAFGTPVLLDQSYQPVATMQSLDKLVSFDEFRIVDEKTALVQVRQPKSYDLAPYGGDKDKGQGWIVDDIFQEIDIETGKVIFEASSLSFADPSDSLVPLGSNPGIDGTTPETAWDYFHLNSVDKDAAGNYLVSGRHTSTIYKISGTDGSLLWRLSPDPAKSTFTYDFPAWSYQHDARFCCLPGEDSGDEMISFLDNANRSDAQLGPNPADNPPSSGRIIKLDLNTKTATQVRRFLAPDGLAVGSQGNVQVLPNGNVFINWGVEGAVSEYAGGAQESSEVSKPIFHAYLDSQKGVQSYRGFRHAWSGATPREKPSVVALRDQKAGKMGVYVSWNGDTDTWYWEFHVRYEEGDGKFAEKELGEVRRRSFETSLEVSFDEVKEYGEGFKVFAVALNRRGVEIERSEVVSVWESEDAL